MPKLAHTILAEVIGKKNLGRPLNCVPPMTDRCIRNTMTHNSDTVIDGPITFAHLAELIGKMSPEQRECHLSFYNSDEDQFYPVSSFCIVQEKNEDSPGAGVLDDEHPYLEI